MADAAPVVHVGENSPEEIAYKMMLLIGRVEGKSVLSDSPQRMTREWIISTYVQCRVAVKTQWTAEDTLKNHPVTG